MSVLFYRALEGKRSFMRHLGTTSNLPDFKSSDKVKTVTVIMNNTKLVHGCAYYINKTVSCSSYSVIVRVRVVLRRTVVGD